MTCLAEVAAEESTVQAASVESARVVASVVGQLVVALASQVLRRLSGCPLAPADLVGVVVAALVEVHSSGRTTLGSTPRGPVGGSVQAQARE